MIRAESILDDEESNDLEQNDATGASAPLDVSAFYRPLPQQFQRSNWLTEVAKASGHLRLNIFWSGHFLDASPSRLAEPLLPGPDPTTRLREAIAAADAEFGALAAETDPDAASAPDHAAWANAQAYLLQLEQELRSKKNAPMSIPAIGPGPQGTVDLHWKNDQFELLINVSGKNTTANFYGDDYGSLVVKGTFDARRRSAELFQWLMLVSS